MKHLKSRTKIKFTAAVLACMLLPYSHSAEANLGLAHQLFIVDHSGSMQGQYEWIGEAVLELQANQEVSTKFGLAEFTKDTRPIKFDGELLGSAKQFDRAVKHLRRGGGTEDGYLAIDKAISQYSAGSLFAPHIILITDEHRTSVDHSVNVDSLSSRLAEAQIPVTAIVNVRFLCDDHRIALGMNSRGLGIVMNADGLLDECNIKKLLEPNKKAHSVADYIDLALSTGGSVWDMGIPRSGKTKSAVFASAFAQVHASAIKHQLQQQNVIPNVSYSPENPKVGDVVTFDASASRPVHQDDYLSAWQWDFESDRQFDVGGATVAHTFATPGVHEITLSIATSKSDGTSNHTIRINVVK